MRSLRIDQVKPGDVTAAKVFNGAGGTLIGVGVSLTEAHLRSLKTAGVEVVEVEGGELHASAAADNHGKRLLNLEARFEGISDPLLIQIKMVAAARLAAMSPTPIQ